MQRMKILILVFAILVQVPYVLSSLTDLQYRLAHIQGELLYGWVTLLVCLFWFFLKWRQIERAVLSRDRIPASLSRALLGFSMCAASVIAELTFRASDFFLAVAPALVFVSGVFAILGSLIPTAISGAYLAGIALPIIIELWADKPLSEFAVSATTLTLQALGFQASASGTYITIQTSVGKTINAFINHLCAGSTSLSVFVCLFILITIDLQPKLSWKIPAFLVAGCLGTLAQAMLRLILMGVIGANYGLEAFLVAHKYLGYIIFPIYFILFTYIYMRSIRGVDIPNGDRI